MIAQNGEVYFKIKNQSVTEPSKYTNNEKIYGTLKLRFQE